MPGGEALPPRLHSTGSPMTTCLGRGPHFLAYDTWKSIEDRIRVAKKDGKGGPAGMGLQRGRRRYGQRAHSQLTGRRPDAFGCPAGYADGFGGSNDNLLGQGDAGMGMPDAATPGPGSLASPGLAPAYPDSLSVSERGGGDDRSFPPKDSSNLPSGDMKVKEAPDDVEQVSSTRTRKWWLRTVWTSTWLIPSFLLSLVGHVEHPDVRLAWRKKINIFWLIFLVNIVVVYIVVFGRLLCPEYFKAWTLDEVAGRQGESDI
ncbi:hypothetical protein BKA70DRAFT_1437418 [Coprinopsis sp. MPI-PUGE-AT-0042]|nr:hypothetical protein BKA70DRAFT_1437418 [Coprinopsis sp. MPI-PUGE-AT-0042]